MPKKTFSFEITGRKLFKSERGAVDDFLRRYAPGSALDCGTSVETIHTRGSGQPTAASMVAQSSKSPSPAEAIERGARVAKKSVASKLPTKELRALIFGMTEQPTAKAGVAKLKPPVKVVNAKPAAVKRATRVSRNDGEA